MGRPPWAEQAFGDVSPPKERAEFIEALDAFFDRAETAAKTGRDSAASLCLEPGNRWNPMIDAISTYVNGAELDSVSVIDTHAYEDTGINWRLRRGYGSLIAAHRAGGPFALNTEVKLIDHSGRGVRIETSQGPPSARKANVTVATRPIAGQTMRFHP